jgi:hypothetical protein
MGRFLRLLRLWGGGFLLHDREPLVVFFQPFGGEVWYCFAHDFFLSRARTRMIKSYVSTKLKLYYLSV